MTSRNDKEVVNMAGIINWNELWKVLRSSSLGRRTLDEPAGRFWDKRAKRFNGSMTVLDVGSGNIFKKRGDVK